MIICYINTRVRQDAFYYFQAEGNTHKNSEVLLSGFFQQFIERSHMDEIILKKLQITLFPPPPLPLLWPSCLQMLWQLNCREHPAVKFYNAISYLRGQLGHCLYSVLNFFCELVMGENICNQPTVSCFNNCEFASSKQHFIGLKKKKKKNSWCNFTNNDNNLKYAL